MKKFYSIILTMMVSQSMAENEQSNVSSMKYFDKSHYFNR